MTSKTLNPNIKIDRRRRHLKASEEYVDVTFTYGTKKWVGSVPTKYRRTGTDLQTDNEIIEHLNSAYQFCNPKNWGSWLAAQDSFWDSKPKAGVTRGFFSALSTFTWRCQSCQLPQNPNWARRTQDIKEFGYTLATDTSKVCSSCNARTTHLLLLPLPRGGESGYETWSPALLRRIINVLGSFDAYEAKPGAHLIPDHKFPEIRWDLETRRGHLGDLTDEQIRRDFQLISNQRNQQKREVCRLCYQTDQRPYPFGIPFFYTGTINWPDSIPKTGKDAEKGCIGCGWYDIQSWRQALVKKLTSSQSNLTKEI